MVAPFGYVHRGANSMSLESVPGKPGAECDEVEPRAVPPERKPPYRSSRLAPVVKATNRAIDHRPSGWRRKMSVPSSVVRSLTPFGGRVGRRRRHHRHDGQGDRDDRREGPAKRGPEAWLEIFRKVSGRQGNTAHRSVF